MNIILFDTANRQQLYPLTLTKAVADLRMGILTVKERWERMTGATAWILTDKYLQQQYGAIPAGEYTFIDAQVIPDDTIVAHIRSLETNNGLTVGNEIVAGKTTIGDSLSNEDINSLFASSVEISGVKKFSMPWELFQMNEEMIRRDFKLVTKGKIRHDTNETVHETNTTQIFVEAGAKLDHCILNASGGPIYIGKNAVVMEGCLIRGPFALGEGAVLKMGAKIYGGTTLGPYCTGGGEIKNSIMMGYSNKAHDGYLGDSIIGEWCNIGAGTSNSNVKNTAGLVNVWNYHAQKFVSAGIKCGLLMGDYSRTAINTSVNTGTVIGICCNVFGEGLTPKVIPDFTWGTKGLTRYEFDKALKDIGNWKKMKNKNLEESETLVLKHIFDHYND